MPCPPRHMYAHTFDGSRLQKQHEPVSLADMLLFKLQLCNDGDGLVVFSTLEMRPCQHNLGKLLGRHHLSVLDPSISCTKLPLFELH